MKWYIFIHFIDMLNESEGEDSYGFMYHSYHSVLNTKLEMCPSEHE